MAITDAIKNEYTKRILRATGRRPVPQIPRRDTPHYRMPKLEANGGWLELEHYAGPEIPRPEYETLEFTTYPTDPNTFFAPITSASGDIELGAFGNFGKCDLDREWTPNAEKCPTIVKWLESVGARFGKVQLLRMSPNTMRECRWGLHLDNNNNKNPESNGWAVRVWHELTQDDSSRLVVRRDEFDKSTETQIPLPAHAQAVVDSQWLWHGGFHTGTHTRYAVIATFESGPDLERWIDSQLPAQAKAAA
ncbi:MAG TPA: hypothetical protein VGY32_08325 [Solirubrobacteraceae bacterium]|jgi:hypothetical protein|nr:hypothetical protein [Solirubrobacteraceae bacterium]